MDRMYGFVVVFEEWLFGFCLIVFGVLMLICV